MSSPRQVQLDVNLPENVIHSDSDTQQLGSPDMAMEWAPSQDRQWGASQDRQWGASQDRPTHTMTPSEFQQTLEVISPTTPPSRGINPVVAQQHAGPEVKGTSPSEWAPADGPVPSATELRHLPEGGDALDGATRGTPSGGERLVSETAVEENERRSSQPSEEALEPPGNRWDRLRRQLQSSDIVHVSLGAILGIFVGAFLSNNGFHRNWIRVVEFPGRLWLNALKLLVLPLIASSMTTSMAELKLLPDYRRMGGLTVGYYLLTTFFASGIGLVMANIFIVPNVTKLDPSTLPDANAAAWEQKQSTLAHRDWLDQIFAVFTGIVPQNIVKAATEFNLLGIICFFVVLGLALDHRREPQRVLLLAIQGFGEIVAGLIKFLIRFTPVGVFALLAGRVGGMHLGSIVSNVGLFLGCVFTGLGLHAFVVYPTIFFLVTHLNPFSYIRNVVPAMMTALGTSSSAATLPVTMECAERNGVHSTIAKFVIPLGATINMDGTSIGFPCAAIFVAYAEGLSLSFGRQLLICIIGTLSSIGAAPIPSSGLVLLIMILTSTNIPAGPSFALILAVDWLYDRPETMVNVIGDSLAARIIQHVGPSLDEKNPVRDAEDPAST